MLTRVVIICTVFLLGASSSYCETHNQLAVPSNSTPVRDTKVELSKWYSEAEFTKFLSQIPNNKYASMVEAGLLPGDGVLFRAFINEKPNKSFQYKTLFNSKKAKFEAMNNELVKQGYVLISHQSIQLFSQISHQAVWVNAAP